MACILAAMTKLHVIVIGVAAVLAAVALFSPHTTEGLGIAAAILTGVFGHAMGGASAAGTTLLGRERPGAEDLGAVPDPVVKQKP